MCINNAGEAPLDLEELVNYADKLYPRQSPGESGTASANGEAKGEQNDGSAPRRTPAPLSPCLVFCCLMMSRVRCLSVVFACSPHFTSPCGQSWLLQDSFPTLSPSRCGAEGNGVYVVGPGDTEQRQRRAG